MERKFKKICILSPGVLPVPDVMGGAVERLITMIVQTNEIEHLFDITVVTCPSEEAIKLQKNYRYTHFVNLKYFNNNFVQNWGNKLKWHIQSWFNKNTVILDYIMSPVNRYLCKTNFDFIVSECSNPTFCSGISKIKGKNKIAVHLHGNLLSSKYLEAVFGNVFSVSDFIRNQYAKDSLISPKRQITIFNGIATEKFTKRIPASERASLRMHLGFNVDDFILVFCGRIVSDKGVLELMHALLSINNPKIKLLILGSSNFGLGDFGDYPIKVKQIADENKDRIKFTGFINNNEVYKYHQISDVGVMPSMHNDPCPLSLFELITSGLPTIATNAGGMPEIATKDTTIFVSMDKIVKELKDAILTLYNDSLLRNKMHNSAIERSKIFTRKRFYHDFCNAVTTLMELNKNE